MRAFVVLIFALVACPKPLPPTPPIPPPDGATVCSAGAAKASAEDVCDGLFTSDGVPCVNCPGAQGCYDEETATYCVAGGCVNCIRSAAGVRKK